MDGDMPEVMREAPPSLQRLVRTVVRGFYGIDHGLVVDILIRNTCIKEDDIIELLKFDKKQLRILLNHLKTDKFVKSRLFVETQDDKTMKQNFYYVNYRSIGNIIKYKLHHMHKRIETLERDSTNRPSFKCPTCQNTYSDLEVNQLIDPTFGTLNCTFCKTEVVEDKAAAISQDTRTLQARFNEQMEPIYKLLKEVENITLSEDVLEPKPVPIPHLHPNAPRVHKPHKARTEDNWSGRSTMNIDYQQSVIIDLGNEKRDEEEVKAAPRWMTESTVDAFKDTATTPSTSERKPVITETDSKPLNDEVMQTLLVQERSSHPPPAPKYHDAEEQSEDEFEDVEDDFMVYVAGQPYHYKDVTQELVNTMAADEKQEYIELGQRLYEDMHD